MKGLETWINKALNTLDYGTINISLTVHQGEIVATEKSIVQKEKFKIPKKTEQEGE